MKIYMAGGLFSTAEQQFNDALRNYLVLQGHEVFLPQDSEENMRSQEDPENAAERIFVSDVGGIDWADVVLANLDGPDPDSGTSWECGYGYAHHKFIVVYRTDFRIHQGFDPINLMLTESAHDVILMECPSVADLGARICKALDELEAAAMDYDGTDED